MHVARASGHITRLQNLEREGAKAYHLAELARLVDDLRGVDHRDACLRRRKDLHRALEVRVPELGPLVDVGRCLQLLPGSQGLQRKHVKTAEKCHVSPSSEGERWKRFAGAA